MANLVGAITQLVEAIPQLARVPQCALPAFAAIAGEGCGADLDCICANENFFVTLQGVILQGTCTTDETQVSLSSTRSICTEAVPWLGKNRGPEVVASITIMIVVATIAVIMRCIARRISNLKFGLDDWFIILALVWAYGITITQYFAVHYGLGMHMLMLDLKQITAFTKCYVATTLIFPVSATAIKISVLFFYQRIFPERRFRKISIIIGVVVIVWFISFVILQFLTCIPLAFFWDKTIPNGKCINANYVAYFGTSPLDILTNIAILVLPIPYLWNLQMRRAKKIAITVIFLLGSFAAIGSIVRIPFLVELKPTDVSYTIVNAGIWLNVECNIGILSACLPVLRPLFSKTFPATLRSKLSSSRTPRYATGSQRLPDGDKIPRSSTLGDSSNVSAGVYGGKAKTHRSWYDNGVSAIATKNEGDSASSQEEMVPLGKIAVRHDVAWEERDRDAASAV